MKQIVFSNQAIKDLSAIRIYTETIWSRQQAIRYRDALLDTVFSIPEKESLFAFRQYKDYFYTFCGHHFIFFRSNETEIKITRILHDKMSFSRHI